MTAKITYRGWIGHYILADRCLFRLNTLVEVGESRVVVSTVGMLRTRDGKAWEPGGVGVKRNYETMAFWASLTETDAGNFWDPDTSRQVDFTSPWCWEKMEDEAKAQAGHEAVVAEIAARLEAGGLVRPVVEVEV